MENNYRGSQPPNKVQPQVLAVFSCFFGQFSNGITYGWISPALAKLWDETSPIPTTHAQGQVIADIMMAGGLVGSILFCLTVDKIGRRWMIFFGAISYIISWVVLIFSSEVYEIYIARVFIGLGFGFVNSVVPTYIGEIAETHIRSKFCVLTSIFFTLGVIFEYALGPYVDFFALSSINILFPILMVISFVWMPESPYFLTRQRRIEDAKKSLMLLRGQDDPRYIKDEIVLIQKFVDKSPQRPIKEVFKEIWWNSNRKVMFIIIVLTIIQQFNGISVVKAHFHNIIEETGLELDFNLSVLYVEILGLIIIFISYFLINSIGRKVYVYQSSVGSIIGTFLIGLSYILETKGVMDNRSSYLAFLGFLCIHLFNEFGFAVSTIIISEIGTASIRAWFSAFRTVLLLLFSTVSIALFEVIRDTLQIYYAYWFYTIILIIFTIVIHFILPETKGKSITEIQNILSGVVSPQQFLR